MKALTLNTLLAVLLTSSIAFAGPITSGGGFAVVCRSHNSEILSAELLDLYEAKNKFNYTILNSLGNLEDDMIAATININRLQGYVVSPSRDDVLMTLNEFFKRVNFLPKTSELPNLNDLGQHAPAPKNCKIEPLAVWNDQSGKIKINAEIWNNLTTLGQSALINHENYYWYERTHLNQSTSEHARAVIATAYSTNAKEVVNEKTRDLPKAYASGPNPDVSLSFLFEKQDNIMTLYFTHLMDFTVLTEAKAIIDLTGIELKNIRDENSRGKVIAVTNESKVIRSKIQSSQSNDWEIEFTFIPNKPVKIGLYQKNALIKELDLSNID
jgi:hypothetical protein